MAFLWTTIHVKNLQASIKFYQEVVGLVLRRRFAPAPGTELAFLGVGETEVELYHVYGETLPDRVEGISIGFTTDDADTLRSELIEKGLNVSEMVSPNPNLQFFYAKDPDGISVQFVEDLRKDNPSAGPF